MSYFWHFMRNRKYRTLQLVSEGEFLRVKQWMVKEIQVEDESLGWRTWGNGRDKLCLLCGTGQSQMGYCNCRYPQYKAKRKRKRGGRRREEDDEAEYEGEERSILLLWIRYETCLCWHILSIFKHEPSSTNIISGWICLRASPSKLSRWIRYGGAAGSDVLLPLTKNMRHCNTVYW